MKITFNVSGDAFRLLDHFIHYASLYPEHFAEAMEYVLDDFVYCTRCLDRVFQIAADEDERFNFQNKVVCTMAINPEKMATKALTIEEELELIKTAPIMEAAAYLGVDLDLAVQMRVDRAVEDTYDKIAAKREPIVKDLYNKWATEQRQAPMEIIARPIEPKGNLYGFASIKIGGIRIDDFKIVANRDGFLFVGMPSKPDKTSKSGYRNTVYIDTEYRENFSKAVLSAHRDSVKALNKILAT